MESKELKRVIDKHLFITLEEETVLQLQEVANFISPTIDVALVSNIVCSFFQNRVSITFKGEFLAKYNEMYGEGLNLPSIIFVILEIYVVLQALQSEEVDEDTKAEYSLIVRNYAVLRKGKFNGLLCQDWIVEMYSYYKKYAPKAVNSSVSYTDLLAAVVPSDNWDGTGFEITDKAVYNQIRSLCAAGYRGRASWYVENAPFTNISSPFAKAYLLVKKMVTEWNWKFISSNPAIKIEEGLGENAKKRKMLSKIVEEVRNEVHDSDIFSPSKKSSMLLIRIKRAQSSSMDQQMYTALEFGVYIYYELVLETYNN